jgi:hypothetical protein
VLNVVKNGQTVPLRFEVFNGSTEVTDVAIVASLTYAQMNCNATAIQDAIETVATGGTALRYDTAGVSSSSTGRHLALLASARSSP